MTEKSREGREPKPEPGRVYLDVPRNKVREVRARLSEAGSRVKQEVPLQNGTTRLYVDRLPEEKPEERSEEKPRRRLLEKPPEAKD